MHEVIFYNGFNLLIDVLIAAITGYITYRVAWWNGYTAGIFDAVKDLDGAQEQYYVTTQQEQE